MPFVRQAHDQSRIPFDLPETPPRAVGGRNCDHCVNRCRVLRGEVGFCGLGPNEEGEMKGNLTWYHDPLPTNCVGSWVCSGGTGCGYPEYAHVRGPETGFKNLAVFFRACNFNCLYCQNWEFREAAVREHTTADLVSAVDQTTSCICFFGGDPTPQLPFALAAAEETVKARKGNILRICWETNGAMNEKYLDRMVDLSLESGGCVKFDLKARDENLHFALTGVTNRQTFKNFKRAAARIHQRPEPPLLIASTCLVTGYVDEKEVERIARFIAAVDPHIPYSLLGFSPEFVMSDLPPTPRSLADRCLKAARKAGLTRVRLGNTHLLTDD